MSIRARYLQAATPIYATLGNNDAYCGDYDIRLDRTNSTFLEDTADTFLQYLLTGLSAPEQQKFRTTFEEGGYYEVTLPTGGNNRLIVLNSIPFMPSGDYPSTWSTYKNSVATCSQKTVVDADTQMDWFSKLVSSATSGHAWVALHVPPGLDCYSSYSGKLDPDWASQHLQDFKGVFLNSGNALELAGTIAAHSHMASFKLLRNDSNNAASMVLQGPSVSPNHNNNPSFRVVTYDRNTLEISDYRTHYLDLDTKHWRSFSFRESYGQHPVTTSTLDTLYNDMGSNADTWNLFVHNYGTSASKYVSLGHISQSNLSCIGSLTGN